MDFGAASLEEAPRELVLVFRDLYVHPASLHRLSAPQLDVLELALHRLGRPALTTPAVVVLGPNSIEKFRLEFWLEKSIEFWLEISLH